MNWVAGGLVAGALVPLLALGVAMPLWIAAAVAALAGGAAVLLLAPRRRFERLDVANVGPGRIALAQELLADADPLIRRLDAAAASVAALRVRLRLSKLAETARGILDGVEQDPGRLDRVQRFLTYYLPRTVEVAEGYRLLEHKKLPDVARLQATADLLDRLDGAFAQYADALTSADIGKLDIELKLLGSSLDDDLGLVSGQSTALDASSSRRSA